MSNNRYVFKQLSLNNIGMVYKFIKKGDLFIHTMCEGELLYKLGYTQLDIVGKTLQDFYPSDCANIKHQYYQTAWEGNFVQYECEMNGIYQVASLRPVIENGKVSEVIGSCIDITDRIKLQEEVSCKDNLYQTVLKTMSDAICILDIDGKITYLNENAEKIVGFTSGYFNEETINKLGITVVKEDGSTIPFTELPGILTIKKGVSFNNCVYGIKDKNSLTKWVSVSSKPIQISSSNEHAALVFFSDITLQKEQETELRETLAFKKLLLNTPDSGVVAVDNNNNIKVMNERFYEILQLHENENFYRGKSFFDLKLPLLTEEIHNGEYFKTDQRFTKEVETKNNKVIKCSYFPLLSKGNIKIGGMWKFEDITKRRILKKKNIQAKEEAEKANKAKSEFLSNMSHELRTPLNGVLGFAQLLELEHSLSNQQHDFVQEIINGGKHLLNLINEVLDLSKIENGNLNVTLEGIDFYSILNDCVNIIKPMAKKKNITIKHVNNIWHKGLDSLMTEPPELSKNVSVIADPVRLKQVIINLLDNAIKYNHKGGEVTISCLLKEHELVVHVIDTGYGFSSEEYKNLFLPFYRLDGVKEEGTGIGLSLANQLMTLMGGEIGVDSTKGDGSDFWFTIPLSKLILNNEQSNLQKTSLCMGHKASKVANILYIEDNVANLQLVYNIINKNQDYSLFLANNGNDGLRIASEEKIDLILLDINLPDIHGYDLMDMLKRNHQLEDIPVVAVSANAMLNDIQIALEKGFKEYIIKPFNIKTLLSVIEKHKMI